MVFAQSGLPSATARDVRRAGTVTSKAISTHPTDASTKGVPVPVQMPVLRQVVGDTLRALRMRQRRTLREVSSTARVSLGYLSEVERGQKEPSSELLAAICGALDVELSELFADVSDALRREEKLVLNHRLATVPAAGSARIAPAPIAPAEVGAEPAGRVRAIRTVAA